MKKAKKPSKALSNFIKMFLLLKYNKVKID